MGSLSKKKKTRRNNRDQKIAKARGKKEAKKIRDAEATESVIVVK